MKFTDYDKKLIAWLVMVVAIIAAGFLGVKFPIPDIPDVTEPPPAVTYVSQPYPGPYTARIEGVTNLDQLQLDGATNPVLDLTGNCLDLDDDGDTSLCADTDDQIDIELSGADDFSFTANTFTAVSGSSIALASGAYPLGYASSGQQLVYGSSSITGTATAAHGLTTVTFALCTMDEDPTSGAGDGAMCTVAIAANVVTVKVWQDDFVTAATETEVDVHWLVVGIP